MTLRLKTPNLFSRVNGFLFGNPMEDEEVVVDTLRELMARESAAHDMPAVAVWPPSAELISLRDKAVCEKRAEIGSVSDSGVVFLNELLPRFRTDERAQIINDVTSGTMDDEQLSQYLELLEATADLSEIAVVFDDDMFIHLVKGLSHGIKRSEIEEKARSQKEVLVRFGMVMSMAARNGVYKGSFRRMYKDDAKGLGLVLRDPSLESILIRNPERLEKVTELLLRDPTLTGNRIGGIILVEGRPATNYKVSGGSQDA